jgi:hypothetical protein
MTPLLVRADEVAPQPWRNGGGRTRELLAWPTADDWQLRVSVADIEADGPFSAFPDVQRWFAVIEGAGVVLRFADGERRIECGDEPLQFDGAAAPGCRLIVGPTRDLNLMLRGAAGAMHTAADGVAWTSRAPCCGLFAARPGTLSAGERSWALPARTLAWFDEAPAAALTFRADGGSRGTIGWWLR